MNKSKKKMLHSKRRKNRGKLVKGNFQAGGGIGDFYDYRKEIQGGGNYYALDTKILHLNDGKTSSPVIFIHPSKELYVTRSGSVYLVVPTWVNTLP